MPDLVDSCWTTWTPDRMINIRAPGGSGRCVVSLLLLSRTCFNLDLHCTLHCYFTVTKLQSDWLHKRLILIVKRPLELEKTQKKLS